MNRRQSSATAKTAPQPGDYALLVALSLLFGISFTFTGLAVDTIAPATVVAGRLLLAFMLLYPLMRLFGHRLPPIGPLWWWLFASALFGNALPFTLISWGQVKVDAGLTSIFMAVMPLVTLGLAHLFTDDEKLGWLKVTGVLLGLAGVIILMDPRELSVLGDQSLRQLGILGGAICYAVNAIITRRLVRLPRWSAITALMFAASVLMVPVSLWFDRPWLADPSRDSALAVLGLAIGPTAAATVLILVIVGRQGASFLSQINFMVPVFGMLFGVVLLSEQLPQRAYLALLVILAGIAISRLGSRQPGRLQQ